MNKSHLRSRCVLKLDRALSGGMGRQILFYLLVVIACFLLLFGLGLLLKIPLKKEELGFNDFWSMLFYFYDGGLEGSQPGNRWFVYLVNILGSILMGGILIATITNFLMSNRDKAEKGLLRYRLSNHTIFIGIHESMFPLVRTALGGNGYVTILSELPLSEAKDMIVSGLKESIDTQRLIVYHGQRTNPDDLASLCLENAKEVFIFPEMSYPDTDSVNLDVVEAISNLRSVKDGKKLKCTAMFRHDAVVACFERADINKQIKGNLDFWPIIYGEAVTQALLSGNIYGNAFLDERVRDSIRENITPDSYKRVHLFIIGLGEMGRALFVQAARQLHFPNFEKAKSVITLVGEQTKIDALKARYREFFAVADHADIFSYLGDFLDISVQTIPAGNVQDLDTALNNAANNSDELVTVAVCTEDSAEAQKKAISLPRAIYEKQIPVWLYKPDSVALAKMIGQDSFYSNIVIFGEPDKLFGDINKQSNDDRDLIYAQRLNWVYDYVRKKWDELHQYEMPDYLPAGEECEAKWNQLSIRHKWSNLNNAYSIPIKLRSLGISAEGIDHLTEDQIDIISRVEHNRWVAENLLGGYRPATLSEKQEIEASEGKEKEDFKKRLIHVDLCRYDDLLLDGDGRDVRIFDQALVKCIPLILQ